MNDDLRDDFEPAFPDEDTRKPSTTRRALARLDRFMNRAGKRGGGFWGFVRMLLVIALVGPPLWVLAYRFIEAPGTILMLQRSMDGQDVRREPVKLKDISPHLVRAVIAAEDAKFCAHNGFDVEAIQQALESNAQSKKTRGGSTISQQTAKNLFLWPQRDWLRKGAEAYFTGLIDYLHLWPKQRIMEAYLNAAEWGDGLFGAEAAAQARFGVSAANLTPRQAALLAAVLPSPNKWSADRPGPYVRRRAASIQARMWGVRNQGLDLCVLEPGVAPPPRALPKEPEEVLPPLAALPPAPELTTDELKLEPASGDVQLDEPAVAGPLEPDDEATAPASAPGQAEPDSAGGAPLDIAPQQ